MLDGKDEFAQRSGIQSWIDYKLTASVLLTAALLFAADWSSGRSRKSPKKQVEAPAAAPVSGTTSTPQSLPHKPKERVRAISGRELTIEKMQKRRRTTQHFAEDVYGVSFDAPKGYVLEAGELSDMDRGLGYLGALPMEFSEAGGVRIATVEVPKDAHPGTDFVNAFFTVSALADTTAERCAEFSPELSSAGRPLRQKISGMEFTGIPNSEAASMHEYFGKYFHGFSEGTCYEIGYGIVTADASANDGLKKVNNDAVLRRLERILETVVIEPNARDDARTEEETGSAGRNATERH